MRPPWLLVLLAGCALPGGDVATTRAPDVVTGCTDATAAAVVGTACVGFEMCTTKVATCCARTTVCQSGVVVKVSDDCSACPTCADDDGCAQGAWCISGSCQSCPKAECPACPAPFVALTRHGCPTCDCGPPSTCDGCAAPDKCLAGSYAVAGCSGMGCAVARCQDTSCASPSPEGCSTSCGAQSCQTCFANGCVCRQGSWSCTPTCAPPELQPYTTRCKG